MVDSCEGLAVAGIQVGASRQDPETYFLDDIKHYVYAGDTALHVSAAAYDRQTAELIIAKHANIRARNRRGAENHFTTQQTVGPSGGELHVGSACAPRERSEPEADEQAGLDTAAPRSPEHWQRRFGNDRRKRRAAQDHRPAAATWCATCDPDATGKTVSAAASSDWIRELLA